MEINNLKNNVNASLAAQQAQRTQAAQEAKQSPQEKPVEASQKSAFYQAPDQYSPKEPEQPSGLYWMEPGEDGPKINFSDPEKADGNDGKPVNVTTMNTDDVDREIERARKKVEELKAQAAKAEGPERERLEKQLKVAQQELERKDNDGYRRSHAKIS